MAKQLSNLASPTLFIFNSARDTIAGSQKQRARCVCVMPVHFQVLSAFEMQNSSVCGAAKMVAMLPHLHA